MLTPEGKPSPIRDLHHQLFSHLALPRPPRLTSSSISSWPIDPLGGRGEGEGASDPHTPALVAERPMEHSRGCLSGCSLPASSDDKADTRTHHAGYSGMLSL